MTLAVIAEFGEAPAFLRASWPCRLLASAPRAFLAKTPEKRKIHAGSTVIREKLVQTWSW
jgi:hypothetical protein